MKRKYIFKGILCFLTLAGFSLHSQEYFKKFTSISHIRGINEVGRTDLYNFNPVLSDGEKFEIETQLKGKFKDRGTLFLVYESIQDDKINILELKDSKNTILITNKDIVFSDSYQNKIESYTGNILAYSFARDNYGRKNNGVVINKDFTGEENKILEFIFIPDIISSLDRQKIETYLSLKYGISLYDSPYITSVNDTIWASKDHKGFEHRVTGIGRDDNYGLYQRKSGNSLTKDLFVGIDNTAAINNNTFLIWSDNDKSTRLNNTSPAERVGKILRTWKVSLKGDHNSFGNTTIEVLPEILFEAYDNRLETTDDVLWIVKSSNPDFSFEPEYIRQSASDKEKILFEDINFEDEMYFSFLLAPEFFVNYEINAALCNDSTDIPIEIIGGVAPYFIAINGENYNYSEQLKESRYVMSGLPAGFYTVTAKDSFGNSFLFELNIPEKERVYINLKETWIILDAEYIRVIPEISDPDYISGYEWIKDKEIVSDAPVLTTKETGEYSLKVFTADGCDKIMNFRVISQEVTANQINIYPNSSERGQPVYIDFDLSEQKSVEIVIYDISGKEILKENLSQIQHYKHNISLQTSGTYLLMISTEETSLVKKIIIK